MSFAKDLKDRTKDIWEKCYNHPFLQELGAGTLDKEKFQYYLLQDYKYLIEYAKVYALGAVKSKDENLMRKFTQGAQGILDEEMDNHRLYMKQFGISRLNADAIEASLYNKAYTSNMLAVAQTGGEAEILAAIFPCGWTYYDFAVRLKEDYKDGLEDNFYKSWIDMYSSDSFLESFQWFFQALDEKCQNKTEKELKEIEVIFKNSLEFEYLFWDMAYHKKDSF
jgi:thiaminase/transcriptional activator TenA